jgi:hypothetical protein
MVLNTPDTNTCRRPIVPKMRAASTRTAHCRVIRSHLPFRRIRMSPPVGGLACGGVAGNRPLATRSSCSGSAVAPQLKVPPSTPMMPEGGNGGTVREARTRAAPSAATAQAMWAPMWYSRLMTHTKPSPMARRVNRPKRMPVGLTYALRGTNVNLPTAPTEPSVP